MSLKEKSLTLIESGEWIFDLVGPLFRGGLLKRIGSDVDSFRLPVMELSLQAYGVSSQVSMLPRTGRFLNLDQGTTENLNTLAKIANSIFPQAVPASLSSSRSELVQAAENFIDENAKNTRRLLDKWISSYLLLKSVSFRSSSSPHAFGCIFFGEKMDALNHKELAVSIVHEMAHQELFLFNILDRLVLAEADFNLVHAPFQGTVRPPIGRLHSLYALFRMVEFEKQSHLPYEHHQQLVFDTIDSFQNFELTDYAKQLVKVIKTRTETEQDHRSVYA